MYYINKFVGYVTNPVVIAALGGLLSFIAWKFKRRRIAKWIGLGSVVWLWFWMTPLSILIVGAKLEQEFLVDGRVPEIELFPNGDVIVLLGGSMGVETSWCDHAEMWASADRVWQAARLWKKGKAPVIIATSPNVKESTGDLLRDFGIPDSAIVFIDSPRNTEEEAKAVLRYLSTKDKHVAVMGCLSNNINDVPRILLVTSAWHMKRARLMFENYASGLHVICAPSDFENSLRVARPMSFWKMLLPDSNILVQSYIAMHEWIGLFGYKVFRL